MCICKNGPSFQHYFCFISVRMHVHNQPLLIPTFALYLYCQQSFLMRFTSLVVSVQKQPQSLTAHSECYSKPPQKWMGFHCRVSFTSAVLLQHSSSFFFTRTHTGISSYIWSKISVCLETMSFESKYWKMLRLVTSRDKVLISLGLTIKSLLYQEQVQCVILLGRQEIREHKKLLYDLLSLTFVACWLSGWQYYVSLWSILPAVTKSTELLQSKLLLQWHHSGPIYTLQNENLYITTQEPS